MKREVRRFQRKALDSLLLAVEHFNRPHEVGRTDVVLILLDHSFEMLLKSAIVHRGGRIRERGESLTIGVPQCIRRAVSDGPRAFVSKEEALTLQGINGLRNEAQHYFADVSEQQLYLSAQAGITLFDDILQRVYGTPLSEFLPRRVLPISTEPPRDIDLFVESEVETVKQLLQPGRRRRFDASARVRALLVMERAITGGDRPTDREINDTLDALAGDAEWPSTFPGIASLRLTTEGDGISFSLRIVKKEGIPVHTVPEGTPGASVVAVRRVNEASFYSLGRNDVARKCGLTPPRTTAVIRALDLKSDDDYFRVLWVGGTRHERYSMKAVTRIKTELEGRLDMDAVWRDHGVRRARTP